MSQLVEMIWAAGIVTVVAIFGIGTEGPHNGVERVPVCVMTCEVYNAGVTPSEPAAVQWILTSLSGVTCRGKTEYVWNDFTKRVVDKGGHCGVCGTPTTCPKIKQFDEYKEE